MFFGANDLITHYGKIETLKGVTMEVAEGMLVALLGANGAGKSTLFKAISGFIKTSSGNIWFRDERIENQPPDKILQRGIAQVPEGKRIFPDMTVLENLNMGAYARKDGDQAIEKDRRELFEHFPVLEKKAKSRARNLSGGEQQTLVIARALMTSPSLLLMDEPAQGVAPLVVKEIAEYIKRLNESGLTIIVIEHNVRLALGLAEKVYILDNGKVIFEGTPSDFSEDEYTKKVYLGG